MSNDFSEFEFYYCGRCNKHYEMPMGVITCPVCHKGLDYLSWEKGGNKNGGKTEKYQNRGN